MREYKGTEHDINIICNGKKAASYTVFTIPADDERFTEFFIANSGNGLMFCASANLAWHDMTIDEFIEDNFLDWSAEYDEWILEEGLSND